jgi:hypothetical protein
LCQLTGKKNRLQIDMSLRSSTLASIIHLEHAYSFSLIVYS